MNKDETMQQALEQQPVQEPTPWRDMVVVSLVREGVNKHKARELADHFAAQQQAESLSMRMPKVGDKVICLEDESLGEVVSLTAGGSPDIVFDDGSRGTYLLREFAELFGYAEQRQQQAEPPPEWPLIKNILAVFGLDAISFVAKWQAAQRPWQGLTEDEKFEMAAAQYGWEDLLIAAEAKLKEKNK